MERVQEILQGLLDVRGVPEAERDGFLNPSLRDLAKPEELPGIAAAAEAVLASVSDRRQIVVFGDYDCDGVCATAILVRTLTALGAEVAAFIPARLTEGYGMSEASVARMLRDNPEVSLVITVDNGINSTEQIAALKAKGVSVVVTDHHLATVGADGDYLLPDADVVVDPKVAAPERLADLCGAGVAFLLANRIADEARKRGAYSGPSLGGPLLVLAGLATITDIMPLRGQNRIMVAEALRRFRTIAPLGLRRLYDRAAKSGVTKLDSRDFGFLLGPRINAAGRMASADGALELVLSDDEDIARECARIVDLQNAERKEVEQKMTEAAITKIVPGAAAQVIDLPDGHPGVSGIVAARILEKLDHKTPVCVYAGGHGSARAPDGINIRDAFVACDEVLERYGGHAAAGGFSVKEGCMDRFREMLCRYCEGVRAAQPPADECPGPEMWLEFGDITLELADQISRLEPYGETNPEPVFGLRGVTFSEVRPIGIDGRHVCMLVGPAGRDAAMPNRIKAVWWGHGNRTEEFVRDPSRAMDITFTLETSDYGDRHVELRLTGAEASAG